MDKTIKARVTTDAKLGSVLAQSQIPLSDVRIQLIDYLSSLKDPISNLEVEVTITIKEKK